MRQLYLDGTLVHLTKEQNISLNKENNYFSDASEYTYDITLPLADPVNLAFFGPLNRHEHSVDKTRTFEAWLYANGRLFIEGTARITGIDQDEVKLQITAGRSDFFTEDLSRYIDEMRIDAREIEAIYFPIFNETSGAKCNDVAIQVVSNGKYQLVTPSTLDTHSAPSFYLKNLVHIIFDRHLDYDIAENAFERDHQGSMSLMQEFLGKIIVCNASYAPDGNLDFVLPHWTVAELLEEITNLTGLRFLFSFEDNRKTVRIVHSKDIYGPDDYDHVEIEQLVDEFEIDISQDPSEDLGSKNLEYEIDNDTIKKFEQVDQSILDASEWKTAENYIDASNKFQEMGSDRYTKRYSTIIEAQGRQYVAKAGYQDAFGMFEVNHLRKLVRNEDADTISPKIAPVGYALATFSVIYEGNPGRVDPYVGIGVTESCLIPSIPGTDRAPSTRSDGLINIYDSITNDESSETDPPDKLYIAIEGEEYLRFTINENNYGLTSGANFYYSNFFVPYIFSGTSGIAYLGASSGNWLSTPYGLELHAIPDYFTIGNMLAQMPRIDTSVTYKKQFIMHSVPDIQARFLIRGKLYACTKLTVELTDDGLVPLMEGEFLEILE